MVERHLIKVIKRVEREQKASGFVGHENPGLPERENLRGPEATVAGWIDDFRQNRLEQYRTIKAQFRLPPNVENDSNRMLKEFQPR